MRPSYIVFYSLATGDNSHGKVFMISPFTEQKDISKKAVVAASAMMVTLSSLSLIQVQAATITLPIYAKLLQAIEITINTSMDFGTLAITNDVASRVSLDPLSGELRFDGEGGLSLAGGVPRAGQVEIRGAPLPVTVSMEATNIQLSNGYSFLTIDNFNLGTSNAGMQVTVTPTSLGDEVLVPVGATLATSPGQLSGVYVGSNRIFANYQ